MSDGAASGAGPSDLLGTLAWGTDGLLPVVAQDLTSGDVLMVANADR
jgi:phosphoribosyl-AMP cyclohydrolase